MEQIQRDNIKQEGVSLTTKYHIHNYQEVENFLICPTCGKKILNLKPSETTGLLTAKNSRGYKYTVRNDRHRYFFPDEWTSFINLVKNKEHRFFFLTCLHTGGRIMEVLNLRYKDIDTERETVTFTIVKQRKAKKNFFATGKTRSFFISSEFLSEYKSFIRGKTINPESYIFLDNSKLPINYNDLDNDKREKYYTSKVTAYSQLFKRKLKKAGIADWYNFSPHNIRKTYGMWMRAYNKEIGELCYRMGHDVNTYILHYGSSLIFTQDERRNIARIMGEVK